MSSSECSDEDVIRASATTTAIAPTNSSRLLSCPKEIRDQILRECLVVAPSSASFLGWKYIDLRWHSESPPYVGRKFWMHRKTKYRKPTVSSQLLRVNKQLLSEGSAIFYENTFGLVNAPDVIKLCCFNRILDRRNISRIQNLTVDTRWTMRLDMDRVLQRLHKFPNLRSLRVTFDCIFRYRVKPPNKKDAKNILNQLYEEFEKSKIRLRYSYCTWTTRKGPKNVNAYFSKKSLGDDWYKELWKADQRVGYVKYDLGNDRRLVKIS